MEGEGEADCCDCDLSIAALCIFPCSSLITFLSVTGAWLGAGAGQGAGQGAGLLGSMAGKNWLRLGLGEWEAGLRLDLLA